MVVAFRKHNLPPLDDCLYALQATIPHLTRSSLHGCLRRHRISHLPEIVGDKPAKQPIKRYPIGYFHIDIAEVRTEAEGGDQRYHYETHRQLDEHLAAFLDRYNFARRRKTLRGLTRYEAICANWANEPHRFRLEPDHLTSGLNTRSIRRSIANEIRSNASSASSSTSGGSQRASISSRETSSSPPSSQPACGSELMTPRPNRLRSRPTEGPPQAALAVFRAALAPTPHRLRETESAACLHK
jgi:hypothetical protein